MMKPARLSFFVCERGRCALSRSFHTDGSERLVGVAIAEVRGERIAAVWARSGGNRGGTASRSRLRPAALRTSTPFRSSPLGTVFSSSFARSLTPLPSSFFSFAHPVLRKRAGRFALVRSSYRDRSLPLELGRFSRVCATCREFEKLAFRRGGGAALASEKAWRAARRKRSEKRPR